LSGKKQTDTIEVSQNLKAKRTCPQCLEETEEEEEEVYPVEEIDVTLIDTV